MYTCFTLRFGSLSSGQSTVAVVRLRLFLKLFRTNNRPIEIVKCGQ